MMSQTLTRLLPLLLLGSLPSANAFSGHISAAAWRLPRAPRSAPVRAMQVEVVPDVANAFLASPSTLSADSLAGSSLLTTFADQGQNLAGIFFQGSLPPYLAFLYFLGYRKNKTPPLMAFGFSFLLLFVFATIPTGIISKSVYSSSLADVDWLHGGAELLLTVSNVLLVLGLRRQILETSAAEGGDVAPEPDVAEPVLRNVAFGVAVAVAALCASGTALGFEGHAPFFGGLGNLPAGAVEALGLPAEPANALSIPTWLVHFSSVAEFIFAMDLVWRLADTTGNPRWKGVTWGMLPSHASGVAACTYHFFYNSPTVGWLVTLQAGLTALGNLTLAIACWRLAVSNGWTVGELVPGNTVAQDEEAAADAEAAAAEIAAAPTPDTATPLTLGPISFAFSNPLAPREREIDVVDEVVAGQSAATLAADGLGTDPEFAVKLVAVSFTGAYLTKYGELGLSMPFEPNSATALAVFALPPLAVAYNFASKSEDFPLALPQLGGSKESPLSMDDVKKYGVAGTLAYVLTELAFWAVAFPVAAVALYNSKGAWPDFSVNADRAAVLGFIFAGANAARLAVPLRFGAALALAPWVDENIVSRFGTDEDEAAVDE